MVAGGRIGGRTKPEEQVAPDGRSDRDYDNDNDNDNDNERTEEPEPGSSPDGYRRR